MTRETRQDRQNYSMTSPTPLQKALKMTVLTRIEVFELEATKVRQTKPRIGVKKNLEAEGIWLKVEELRVLRPIVTINRR